LAAILPVTFVFVGLRKIRREPRSLLPDIPAIVVMNMVLSSGGGAACAASIQGCGGPLWPLIGTTKGILKNRHKPQIFFRRGFARPLPGHAFAAGLLQAHRTAIRAGAMGTMQ
jgi:hypothetical protein